MRPHIEPFVWDGFGVIAGVSLLDPLAEDGLEAEELSHLNTLGELRRATWLGGRRALRQALSRAGAPCGAVLSDERGAPILPAQVMGSIAHKETIAVALADKRAGEGTVEWRGVDVEYDEPLRVDISRRVLRDSELETLAKLESPVRDRFVRVSFAIKEAIYKAIDPMCRRYVGFREVALELPSDLEGGPATVQLFLSPAPEHALVVRAAFRLTTGPRDEPLVLAAASAHVVRP